MRNSVCHLILFLSLLVCSGRASAFDALRISNLQCEMLNNPKGIDATKPRFSWQAAVEERGMKQTAYQVIVASSLSKLANNDGDLWNSGKLSSDQSIQVTYA